MFEVSLTNPCFHVFTIFIFDLCLQLFSHFFLCILLILPFEYVSISLIHNIILSFFLYLDRFFVRFVSNNDIIIHFSFYHIFHSIFFHTLFFCKVAIYYIFLVLLYILGIDFTHKSSTLFTFQAS